MRALMSGLLRQFRNMFQLALAVLREIFDEAAYERFLIEHQLSASTGTYAAFCRDHEQRKLRRPRCC